MDLELTALAIAGAAALSGAVGVVWGRGTIEPEPSRLTIAQADVGTASFTIDSAHVHEGTTFDNTGWHCDCGKHLHVYTFESPIADQKKCVCGKDGTGKEWS